MVRLNSLFTINRRIGSLVEIKKMIGSVVEYTIVHKDSMYLLNGSIMIQKSVFNKKNDFFRKVRSI